MKALLIAIACAAAVWGLAACGAADGEDGAAQAQATPTPASAVAQARTPAPAATTQARTPAPAPAATAQVPTPAPAATTQAQTPTPAAVATAPPGGTPESLRAPEFSLPSADGGTVSLSGLLNEREGAALVFYRGFF